MWDLQFFNSGEWQVIDERLDDYDKALGRSVLYTPKRELIFAALDKTPRESVKAVIMGQDPYPNYGHATGLAFSVPRSVPKQDWPPTLTNLMVTYEHDLHYPSPSHGDLSSWADEGVLMVNAFWTCGGQPRSHHWTEWTTLTTELARSLNSKDIPVVLLGGVAHQYAGCFFENPCLCLSHPSPRGYAAGRTPFRGSHPFTWINSFLDQPINWRIPDVYV